MNASPAQMSLVPLEFWLQMVALVFASGILYQQVRGLRLAVTDLARSVQNDHDQRLKMEGTIESLNNINEQKYDDLERRVCAVERRCETMMRHD